MIEVRPDPAHPHGGFALLEVEAGALSDASASVEVFDSFAGRYLGEGGWQATRFAFGPYPVTRSGDRASVRVGPEIVNRMTEYQPVRMQLGPLAAELSWPDDVVPAAEAALAGGILTTPTLAPKTPPGPIVRPPTPEPDEPGAKEAESVQTEDETGPAVPGPGPAGGTVAPPALPSSRKPPLLAGLAALLLLAGGAAYFLTRQPEPTPAPPPTPAPVPVPEPEPELACGVADLSSLAGQGFATVADRLRECGPRITPDDALGLLDAAAKTGDPAALALFGRVYDGDSTDEAIENGIRLTFADNPAQAAEYYDRARQAGSTEAGPLLEAVCRRLLLMTDTLSQSAHEDHCGP